MDQILQGNIPQHIKFRNPAKPDYKECLHYFDEYLKGIPFISEADLVGLHNYWDYLQLAKNEQIVLPGEVCKYIAFICKGAVKHFTEDKNGRYMITFATDAYFCTAINSFFSQRPATNGLISVQNTFGLKISLAKYRQLATERPVFSRLFKEINDEETGLLFNRIKSFQSSDARGRYDLLMQQNSSVFNSFSMQDISNYLGIQPETLSRLRSEKNGG